MSAGGGDLFNMMRLLAGQQQPTVSLDGYVQAYYPTEIPGSPGITAGTIDFVLGTTAGHVMETDPESQGYPLVIKNVPLLVPVSGLQGGPLGGERCVLIARQGGAFGALLYYGDEDAPGTPGGESWMVHWDPANLTAHIVQAAVKLTNDGENQGDGQGAVRLSATAFASIVTALLMLGAEGLDKTERAVITKQDLDAALASYTADVINPLCLTLQAGPGVPPPTGMATTSGSSIVKAAP